MWSQNGPWLVVLTKWLPLTLLVTDQLYMVNICQFPSLTNKCMRNMPSGFIKMNRTWKFSKPHTRVKWVKGFTQEIYPYGLLTLKEWKWIRILRYSYNNTVFFFEAVGSQEKRNHWWSPHLTCGWRVDGKQ